MELLRGGGASMKCSTFAGLPHYGTMGTQGESVARPQEPPGLSGKSYL